MQNLLQPSPKHLKQALFAFFGPLILAVLIIVGMTSLDLQILNRLFPILMLAAILGTIVGPIWGIFRMGKWEMKQVMQVHPESGKGEASNVPEEIKKWNWGAAGLTWIWGVYNHTWLSLLTFIPIVNLVMFLFLGAKGNEWAWKENQWESVEAFLEYQRKWKVIGIIFFVFQVIGLVLNIGVIFLQLFFQSYMEGLSEYVQTSLF